MRALVGLAACLGALRLATLSVTAAAEPGPSAQELLNGVVAHLPQDPLDIHGDLIIRKARGVVIKELHFGMLLRWGDQPATAEYLIRDSFGTELEKLTLVRHADGKLETHYASGSPLAPAPTPPLDARIQDADLSWTDLSLDFLWWPGGKIVGSDEVRGRPCLIVDVPAPARTVGTETPSKDAYAHVRVWVDRDLFLLLQAEAYNAAETRVRRLWVRSLQKRHDRWMIKDLEIQAYPPVQRTRLHIRDSLSPPPDGAAEVVDTVDPAPVAELSPAK